MTNENTSSLEGVVSTTPNLLERNSWDWKTEISENAYMSPIQKKIIERLHDPSYKPFKLDESFVARYDKIKPPFGFNGFGELVYKRTYSRVREDGRNEEWPDTIKRVVNGTYNLQKRWIQERGLEWSDYKAQKSAEEMFERMFHMRFLPPGRGLWAMGSEITEERGLYSALNNCAFVSTANIKEEYSKPFKFLMDMSMLGVGVGFDTKGAGSLIVKGPDFRRKPDVFDIPDNREGWVESVGRIIDSYLLGVNPVEFDYSQLREEGSNINGFGGKSSGYGPLKELHQSLEDLLRENIGRPLGSRAIVDIQNLIGKCVVSGNVRRTAEIALGDPLDEEFLDLKNYKRNPERAGYGWTSNNSIFAELGMNYHEISERIRNNGEPGLIWLENMKKFGRTGDAPNFKDKKAMGCNPCVEQSLESYELCNLVETFPNNHHNKEDFLRTLKFAYMYAKTVALGETHWAETNRVLLRNRRIGCSVSGIAQFVAEKSLHELKSWLRDGYDVVQQYDQVYSDWMTVPKSIKTTSVKPSGTVSSVAGSTPGMHWPISEYYIRRMRLAQNSDLVNPLKEAGFYVEQDRNDLSSLVVEFPVHVGEGIRSEEEVSMWEQLEMVSFLQENWADNQVSSTIKFDPEKEGPHLEYALNHFQYKLKGISMLPKLNGVYDQPPFEPITREEYFERTKALKPIDFSEIRNQKTMGDRFCNSDSCEIKTEELFRKKDNS
ncbi:fused protease/ribonucleoside-triphosphate reductase [Patescibacteria group bacterium]|nr:fused protease/ribonucleoside-triphosphate reductase [Patescibacteria group bacterium]